MAYQAPNLFFCRRERCNGHVSASAESFGQHCREAVEVFCLGPHRFDALGSRFDTGIANQFVQTHRHGLS